MSILLTDAHIQKEAAWLKSYAKKKPIKHQVGNYWGINRNRCTRIDAEVITRMVDLGLAKMAGPNTFYMV